MKFKKNASNKKVKKYNIEIEENIEFIKMKNRKIKITEKIS